MGKISDRVFSLNEEKSSISISQVFSLLNKDDFFNYVLLLKLAEIYDEGLITEDLYTKIKKNIKFNEISSI